MADSTSPSCACKRGTPPADLREVIGRLSSEAQKRDFCRTRKHGTNRMLHGYLLALREIEEALLEP